MIKKLLHDLIVLIVRSIPIFRGALCESNPLIAARAIGNLIIVHKSLGQFQQATEYIEQQLNIARELGDRRQESNALGNLGYTYNSLESYSVAIDYIQQQLEISQAIGDRRGTATAFNNLGESFRLQGVYAQGHLEKWGLISR